MLRAYNGSVSQSNPNWSGFGDGNLQTGVNANGAGVSVQFMTSCASMMASSSSSPRKSATMASGFDTSLAHKVIAPLSVALLLLATVLYRLSLPVTNTQKRNHFPLVLSAALSLASWAVGIAGLATAFTGIVSTSATAKQSSPNLNLKTVHGKAGLVLFVAMYGLLPALALVSTCGDRLRIAHASSADAHIAEDNNASSVPSATPTPTSTSPFSRWFTRDQRKPLSTREKEPRQSSDNASVHSTAPQRKFEVLNRPARVRHISMDASSSLNHGPSIHTLGAIDWLERRRVLSDVVR